MREIRESGKTTSVERVAVMAALNLAHDFQRSRATTKAAPASKAAPADGADLAAARRRIASMHAAIDQLLPGKEKLF
jgi:cell division protein ZapA